MTIYVDIDETICEHPGTDPSCERDYTQAVPLKKNIEAINKLYKEGNTIIYWTARGSLTGVDWTALTTQQLEQWGALYHKLRADKPYYDLFICDKALNSREFFKSNS